jgi:carbon monoxide dehydrogenase subunit G
MIQRYFKIVASREELRREVLAFDSWAQWWPGVQSVRVIDAERRRPVVELVVKAIAGATIQMTIEVDHSQENAIHFHQTRGWFRSYRGNYVFLPAPDGAGTTLKVSIEADGGLFVPRGMVYARLSESLEELGDALARRVSERSGSLVEGGLSTGPGVLPAGAAGHRGSAARRIVRPKAGRRKLAHVFGTPRGWEVWIGGLPHLLKAMS